ncbi:MAG: DHH family phosphoesterase [Haloferacaceae archaeon]
MDDELIDSDGLSLSRKSRLPGEGFFYPDSLDEEYADRRAREAIEGSDVVVVADTDADGLGCVALLREAYDAALEVAPFEADLAARLDDERRDEESDDVDADGAGGGTDADERDASPVGLVAAGPHSLDRALERVAEYADPGVDVYVCDLSPDSYEAVGESVERLCRRSEVRWFDHHQWDDGVATAVREAGVDLVVGESDEECSTDVTLRSMDVDFPPHLVDLAAVVRDHDLWVKEDPRSDDLADYAHWTSPEEFVTVVGRYGPDLPDPVQQFIADRRVEKDRLIERAVDRADLKAVGEWTVGVTYGRCSQNEVADALREQGADAAVVVKPAGSASIRGTESFERCHEVAEQVNGGGHPRAAGCKPDIYDDMLDYAHHWTTEGAATKRVILAAFERLAAE